MPNMLHTEQMADDHQTPDPTQGPSDKASKVIAEALSSMREDEKASPLADALEGAWSTAKFDLEAALKGIEAGSQEKGSDERE